MRAILPSGAAILHRATVQFRMHVVFKMMRFVVRGNRAGDCWICHNPFQKELRPRADNQIPPPNPAAASNALCRKIAGSKWPIRDHRDSALLRQCQNAFLRFRFHQRIIDLEEIELLVPQQLFDFAQSSGSVMRDPRCSESGLAFSNLQSCELCVYVHEIMHLHQVDSIRAAKATWNVDD
jgi:hypothetical protein